MNKLKLTMVVLSAMSLVACSDDVTEAVVPLIPEAEMEQVTSNRNDIDDWVQMNVSTHAVVGNSLGLPNWAYVESIAGTEISSAEQTKLANLLFNFVEEVRGKSLVLNSDISVFDYNPSNERVTGPTYYYNSKGEHLELEATIVNPALMYPIAFTTEDGKVRSSYHTRYADLDVVGDSGITLTSPSVSIAILDELIMMLNYVINEGNTDTSPVLTKQVTDRLYAFSKQLSWTASQSPTELDTIIQECYDEIRDHVDIYTGRIGFGVSTKSASNSVEDHEELLNQIVRIRNTLAKTTDVDYGITELRGIAGDIEYYNTILQQVKDLPAEETVAFRQIESKTLNVIDPIVETACIAEMLTLYSAADGLEVTRSTVGDELGLALYIIDINDKDLLLELRREIASRVSGEEVIFSEFDESLSTSSAMYALAVFEDGYVMSKTSENRWTYNGYTLTSDWSTEGLSIPPDENGDYPTDGRENLVSLLTNVIEILEGIQVGESKQVNSVYEGTIPPPQNIIIEE